MPRRTEPLITGEIYHIFNKTIESKEIFNDLGAKYLLLKLLDYYKSVNATISYSKLKLVDPIIKDQIIRKVHNKESHKVEIYCFCLMPTHFHFLLRQKKDNGIQRFIGDNINSLTRTFNLINERRGPIFLPRFKSVRIKNEEQLKHVFRYIHLNPYSSQLIDNFEDLTKYYYSSLIDYLKRYKTHNFIDRGFILRLFNGKTERLKKFIFDQADYQRSLETIKYIEKLL